VNLLFLTTLFFPDTELPLLTLLPNFDEASDTSSFEGVTDLEEDRLVSLDLEIRLEMEALD
jgi:hypothetical protein